MSPGETGKRVIEICMEVKKIKCRAEGVYQGLSRGAIYELVYEDPEKQQVTILDSNGRKRKYPSGCFVSPETSLVSLIDWSSVDECTSNDTAAEVTLQLSDSTQRILFFFTKEHLERLIGGSKEPYVVVDSFILVDEISPQAISKALQYLDSQEQLVKMSRPFQ